MLATITDKCNAVDIDTSTLKTLGYSVFVVTPTDPDAPLAMPRVLADETSAILPEPSLSSATLGTRPTTRSAMSSSTAPSGQDPLSQPDFCAEIFDE